MGQAKDCSPCWPIAEREGGGLLWAVSPFGREGPDPFLDLYFSRALAKLSDLSQELKGILFGFKIFSLLDFLKIGYHKHKITPK